MIENNFLNLIKELKLASEDIWAAKMLLKDLSSKYAPLCIQIIVEGRQIPSLNNRMEKRRKETNLDAVHPDFWDSDLIIAFYEYFEGCENLQEGLKNVSRS